MPPDPFAILNLPHRYAINRDMLRQAYLRRSAELHPDASGESEDDDRIAELNHARAVLEEPGTRAHALLEQLAAKHNVALSPADERSLPDGFLSEIMEIRSQIEQAVSANDATIIGSWRSWAHDQISRHQNTIASLFDTVNATDNRTILKQIRQELNAWKYIQRLSEQLPT